MNFQPSFRVHVAERLCFVDMPVIITTAYTNPGGYPRGEWFLIIPEKEKQLIAQQTRIPYKEFPPAPVTFTEEFLLDEVLYQATARLQQHIIEQKGIEAASLLSKGLGVLPSNQNLFVNLWMRGGYKDILEGIHEKTKCAPLEESLLSVFDLPKFTNQAL